MQMCRRATLHLALTHANLSSVNVPALPPVDPDDQVVFSIERLPG